MNNKMKEVKEDSFILCLLCPKKYKNAQQLTNIYANPNYTNILSEALGFSVKRESGHPETVCYHCIFQVNYIIDFRRIAYNQVLAYNRKKSSRERVVDVKPFTATNFKNNDVNGLVISEVREEVTLADTNEGNANATQVLQATASTNNNNNDTRLLEPMFEEAECVLLTESGGEVDRNNIGKYRYLENHIYTCSFCNINYKRASYYKKHLSKHAREDRYKVLKLKKVEKRPQFKCPDCDEVYENKNVFRNHLESHKNREVCPHCKKEFMLYNDFIWHKAICDGIMQANEEPRRRTRSTCTPITDTDTLSVISDFSHLSRQTDINKMIYIKKWVDETKVLSNNIAPVDDPDLLKDDTISMVSGFTNNSNLTDFSMSGVSESDFGSNKTSISIRTAYSKKQKSLSSLLCDRNNLTNRSCTRFASRRISQIDLELCSQHDEPQKQTDLEKIIRKKRRQVNLVKRLTGKNIYLCDHCGESKMTIKEIMAHEIDYHNVMLLYTCEECNAKFTKELYLDKHLVQHQSGPYRCVFCDCYLDTNKELTIHLDLHKIRSYKCDYCDKLFLKEEEKSDHMIAKHFDSEGRLTAKLHRKCSIVSRVISRKQMFPQDLRIKTNDSYNATDLIQTTVENVRENLHCRYKRKLGGDVVHAKLKKIRRAQGGVMSFVSDEDDDDYYESDEDFGEMVCRRSDFTTLSISPLPEEDNNHDPFFDFDYVYDDYDDYHPDTCTLNVDYALEYHNIFSTDSLGLSLSESNSPLPLNEPIDVDAYWLKSKRNRSKVKINLPTGRTVRQVIHPQMECKSYDASVIPSFNSLFYKSTDNKKISYFDLSKPFRIP